MTLVDRAAEQIRVDNIAADSWYGKGVNADTVEYSVRVFSRFWCGQRCLELGPAEGLMTGVLAERFPRLTIVEGALDFCVDLRRRFPDANVVHSLFEEFETPDRFDTVVLGHVLEHVESPVDLLRHISQFLAPGGVFCSAVPNARSLHRQAAVIMGLLPTEHSLNEMDLHHGHRRVYNPESFRADFLTAGLKILHFGGYWIKPLSNAQLEANWTTEMIEAFFKLGERYPDIAAEIYVIAAN